jgi:hypothetical protein
VGQSEFVRIGVDYRSTSDVPKHASLHYHCLDCDSIIPSLPSDNVGCDCGNVYIDKDLWRLVIVNFSSFEVLRATSAPK